MLFRGKHYLNTYLVWLTKSIVIIIIISDHVRAYYIHGVMMAHTNGSLAICLGGSGTETLMDTRGIIQKCKKKNNSYFE